LADELMPGLWWLHGTRGSNVYLVEADDGRLVLVDTGFGSSTRAILGEISDHGGVLTAILLTHMHSDHSGAASPVRAASGAPVFAGKGDCLEREGKWVLRPAVGRTHVSRFVAAWLRHRTAPATPVDHPIEGPEEVLPGIRAVPVPGHTPGSYCYLVERLGVAFVGDLVISHEGSLTRSMRLANQDDQLYLQSLREFSVIAPTAGLPGHGVPVLEGFGDALRELAALPRRRPGARISRERILRMFRFARGLSRRRV